MNPNEEFMNNKIKVTLLVFCGAVLTGMAFGFERKSLEHHGDGKLNVVDMIVRMGGEAPAFGPGSLSFLEEAVNGKGKVAILSSSLWAEVGDDERPISLISVAWVHYGENEHSVDTVKAGVWLRSLLTGEEYRLMRYEARFSFPEDFEQFADFENGYHMLLSRNQISTKSFILIDGKRQFMILANGLVDQYGSEYPTEKSKAFKVLFNLIRDGWDGTRMDLASILEEVK